ncbi:MAG: hypothetical protein EBU90_31170, partial [Proteobacteria bacterium]|nr:hypothetical protein [Pseudomonadota bacterium]
ELSQQILTESASEEHDVMNRWPYTSPYLQEERDGYGDDSKFKQDTDAKSFKPGTTVPRVKKFGRISRAMPKNISGHSNRTASRVTTITGDDPGAPRSQRIAKTPRVVKKDGKWVKINEDFALWMDSLLDEGYDLGDYTLDEMYDLYDLVLSHLLDEAEGSYGQTPKAHLAFSGLARKRNKVRRTEGGQPSGPGGMPKGKKLQRQKARGVSAESYDMANMSEGWVDAIVDSYIQD